MSARVLVVGSVALDDIDGPFGRHPEVLGGSASYFCVAASYFTPQVSLVAVVGDDFPGAHVDLFASRGVDCSGLERVPGKTFRWRGRYRHDLNSAETLETRLGVFSHFSPKIPAQFRNAPDRKSVV